MQVLSSAHNPKLSALSTMVKLAQFEKVKETLNKMITDLTQEKEDEIALKDWCYDEIRKNERTTEMTDRTKEGWVAKIDDLAKTIDTKRKTVASKTEEMGKQAQGDRKANLADLEPLLSSNMNLQDSCNFLMKNYAPRVQAL